MTGVRLMALRYENHGDGDRLIAGLAGDLAAAGLRLGGLVQAAEDAAMTVTVLGADVSSSLAPSHGRAAAGCRLDAGALEVAAARVEAALHPGLDLVILSKFGRREAEGRGVTGAVAVALDLGLPVLTSVRAEHAAAFAAFAGDLGAVTADVAAARDWALRAAALRQARVTCP